jgi:glycosyltransferase involved in cell wall biosynthesis
MATELPVIATHVGSVSETVRDGDTGYLVASGDAESMARRAVYLSSHPEVAHQFGVRGREVVKKHWSLERMVEGYQQLILDVYRQKCGGGLLPKAEEPVVASESIEEPVRDAEPVG